MEGTNFYTPVTSTLWSAFTDPDGYITVGRCTGAPPTTAGTFAHGAQLIRTDSGTGSKALYENVGSTAVPSWNLIGDITATEITLTQGGVLVGNTTGVATIATLRTTPLPVTVATRTTSVTLTATAVTAGLIQATPTSAPVTYTLPTGTALQGALPSYWQAGDSFDFSLVNTATTDSFIVTMANGAAGATLVGNATIPANSGTSVVSSATFRVVEDSANNFSVYRIA